MGDAAIPPMIRHLFLSECPACGQKWLASHWDAFRYPAHYASVHLGIPLWRDLR
jgi:hypothetical protein